VTPLQARAAMDQLEGTLTAAIAAIDASLFDLAARLEASLDFPEEGFHFVTRDDVAAELRAIAARLDELRDDGRIGRLVREGQQVAILGAPNAGKSSLFNALLGAARAIVTDVPGTTRDLITERVDIGGLAVALVDTAGLRDAADAIEAEGVARARQAQQVASLAIIVVDGSAPLSEEGRSVIRDVRPPRVIVASKADLPRVWSDEDAGLDAACAVAVSALTGSGMDDLRRAIVRALTSRDELRDPPAVTNVRHLALVDRAHDALARSIDALRAGATEELVLVDVIAARGALEEITGRRTADDLLHHIFATFCIGK
jgi:tRNA modification GTPase